MSHSIIKVAEDTADRVLFPAAMETDSAEVVPRAHLDVLGEAGLYGLTGPVEYGGLGLEPRDQWAVIERLASGCLSTTFVWIQHQTPVRELASSPNEALREQWLAEMCAGRLRGGIALGGLQQGSAGLRAEPVEGGWLISGEAPYVTGWGLLDVVLIAALTPDNRVLRALVDAVESEALGPERLRLVAANASSTVRLHVDGLFVPWERITSIAPYSPPPPHDGGGRGNGSLALGVTRRCLHMLGASKLDEELDARRRQLDEADEQEMAEARAAAAELAVRAATALVVARGSRAILGADHAQRLYREAAFLLVFGTRASIKASLLRRLGTGHQG